jgi:hypothetical protein
MNNPQKKFVIQQHTTPDGVHWDLMLEMDDCLWTWRLAVPPDEIGNEPVRAERIHDHSLRFLTYEGPVQNDTGDISIADKGIYTLFEQANKALMLEIQGNILRGSYTLSKTKDIPLWTLKPAH